MAKPKKQSEMVEVDNLRCPMTGVTIDQGEVPEERVRHYKGYKIGFCCPECPGEWDGLDEDEKDDRLEEVMETEEEEEE